MATITVTTGKNTTGSTYTKEIGTTGTSKLLAHITVTDDGSGKFFGPSADDGEPEQIGSVAYVAKTVSLQVVRGDSRTEAYKSDYEDSAEFAGTAANGSSSSNTKKGGEYTTAAAAEDLLAGNSIVARYRVAPGAPQARTMTFTPPAVTIDLCPRTSDRIVPGSVRFAWMGTVYEDFEGQLYRGRTEGDPGIRSGAIDYALGVAMMTDYVVGGSGPGDFTLLSLWTQRHPWSAASVFFRSQSAPLKPGGLVLSVLDMAGAQITATANNDGSITGTHVHGRIDYPSGVVELQFGDYVLDSGLTAADKAEWWYSAADVGAVQPDKIWRPWPVDPTTLRYNSVAYFYLPLDADILGLDPVRLPQDGRVPIFRRGGYVVLGHAQDVPAAVYAPGNTVDCARTRLSRVHLIDADGELITGGYSTNLDAGTVTIVDVTGWAQPVIVRHVIEDMAVVSDVQITGRLALNKQITHDYPVGSVLSSAIMAGDLRARLVRIFDQYTWDRVSWLDSVVGDVAPASYNHADYPVELTNAGALKERFALHFTSSTAFSCYGEHVGLIATGSTGADFAPVNPISGQPYFTLRQGGWGSGWIAGNTVFLHFDWAGTSYAVVQAVQPSEPAGADFSFELVTRGDIDRP